MKHAVLVRTVLALTIMVFSAATSAQPFDLGLPKTQLSDVPEGEELVLSGQFKLKEGSREGILSVTAAPADGWYTYSMTQATSNGMPSEIIVADSSDYTVVSEFEADRDHKDVPDGNGGILQKHTKPVTWTASLKLSDDVDPTKLTIDVIFKGQVCDEAGLCIPIFGEEVPVTFGGYYTQPKPTGSFRDSGAPVEIRGYVEPKTAAVGGTVKLVLEAIPDKSDGKGGDFHIYALGAKKVQEPTQIALTKRGDGWDTKAPTTTAEVVEDADGDYHKGDVAWTIELTVPREAENRDYTVSGIIGYQVCNEKGQCDKPRAVKFTVKVPVASVEEEGRIALTFTEAVPYKVAKQEADNMSWGSKEAAAKSKLPLAAMLIAAAFLLTFLAGLALSRGVPGFTGLYANLYGFALLLAVLLVLSALHGFDGTLTGGTLWSLLTVGFGAWLIARTPSEASVVRKLVTAGSAAGIVAVVATAFFVGKEAVPACALIAGGGLAIFCVLNIPSGAKLGRKIAGGLAAVVALLVSGGIAAFAMQATELPWESYSRKTLDEYRGDHVVLVDFTANW